MRPADSDGIFMCHADLRAVIDDGRLVQGKLEACGGLQSLPVVAALIQNTVHIVVIEKGGKKIALRVR